MLSFWPVGVFTWFKLAVSELLPVKAEPPKKCIIV